MIKIYFPPSPDEEQQRTTDPPSSPVLEVPAAVLQRHGARVLDPTTAPVAPGRPRPQATIYRAGTVLVPDQVRQDVGLRNGLNEVLTADLKVTLELPGAGLDRSDESARSARAGDRVRPAGTLEITPTEVLPEGGVDAWRVLQHLRWVADNDGGRLGPSKDLVDQITLDHLLVGSAIDGYGGAILVGMNTASHGSPDLTDLFDRPQPGTSGRIPMTMVLRDPGRPAPPAGGRRPVVAVLDTGIAAEPQHPWLPVTERKQWDQDSVVIVDEDLQALLKAAAQSNQYPRPAIDGWQDRPPVPEPLLGELSTHFGHGTFIAGIIRQLAPAAQILSIRVMHPDGFAHQDDLLIALQYLVDDVRASRSNPQALTVDVVSLSLGYFHETAEEVGVTADLEPLLQQLLDLGVTVVAAAGNFSTSREFYPAASSVRLNNSQRAPLISVGALNPNRSTARFSDEAAWVGCYASGAAVASTFPQVSGALLPLAQVGRRQAFDPDNFESGFALWSGTSFAAPAVAGSLADALFADHTATDPVTRARRSWTAVQDDPDVSFRDTP